jgi:hypothetical protein
LRNASAASAIWASGLTEADIDAARVVEASADRRFKKWAD